MITFLTQRILTNASSIYDTIKKNNLPLFSHKNSIIISKTKQKMVSLDADWRLYANLYVACQSREGNLESFFAHENHSYPVSISEYGRLRKCSAKSDLLKCLEEVVEPSFSPPGVEVKVIDGAAFVNINMPRSSKTLGEYCEDELIGKIKSMSQNTQRLDFVFDTYKTDSIKSETRGNRGKGIRVAVRTETPIMERFQEFMRNNENKTDFFMLLADAIISIDDLTTTFIATSLENAL